MRKKLATLRCVVIVTLPRIFFRKSLKMSSKPTVIHWFRKGLRVHDNPALLRAVDEAIKATSVLRPVFILDPGIIKW